MTDSRKDPDKASASPDVGALRNVGRRRILQAGISAAPFVMTVASRPVWAIDCRTPSGFVSGFASGAPVGSCSGGLPSYWISHTAQWPAGINAATALFNPIFDPDLGGNPTLLAVLGMANTLQSYIVAAYLNNAATSVPMVPETILPKNTILAMWTQVNNDGGFGLGIPGPTRWNGLQVIDYLKSTMTTP